MQLMPERAAELGVRDSVDPTQNVDGGVRHIRDLLQSFGGDVTLAVAAYNAGEGAVRSYGGVPPFAETREYVRRVRAMYDAAPSGDRRAGDGAPADLPRDRGRHAHLHEPAAPRHAAAGSSSSTASSAGSPARFRRAPTGHSNPAISPPCARPSRALPVFLAAPHGPTG